MTYVSFFHALWRITEKNVPEGGVLARFYRPEGGKGFELIFPGGGEFAADQKYCQGVLPRGMVRLGID